MSCIWHVFGNPFFFGDLAIGIVVWPVWILQCFQASYRSMIFLIFRFANVGEAKKISQKDISQTRHRTAKSQERGKEMDSCANFHLRKPGIASSSVRNKNQNVQQTETSNG